MATSTDEKDPSSARIARAIDEILQKAASSPHRQHGSDILDKLEELLVSAYGGLENGLSSSLQIDHQHVLAASFIRLMRGCTQCWEGATWRLAATSVVDRTFAEDVYPKCHVTERTQNHEKRAKLSEFVENTEKLFSETRDAAKNLELLGQTRNKFLQAFNDRATRALIKPFFSETMTASRLQEVFLAVGDYLEATGQLLTHFQRTDSLLTELEQDASEFGTSYAARFIGGMCGNLRLAVRHHLENSPISKPAAVHIGTTGKKYPLGEIERDLRISIKVVNDGPGHALSSSLILTHDDSIELGRHEMYLGNLAPGSVNVDIMARTTAKASESLLQVDCNWTNFDGTDGIANELLELSGQARAIDWDALRREDPYALEPVSREDELVGRSQDLAELEASVSGKTVTGCYVHGQKRVGKTSLVKTLQTRLQDQQGLTFVPIYLEEGQYDRGDAASTLDNLVEQVCKRLKRADGRLASLATPSKAGALSPLSDFLDEVAEIAPDLRVILILDEFDELPRDLFGESDIGRSFFQSLRAIGGKPLVGIILVGGEKLEPLIRWHWEALNKLRPVPVGYFSRQKQFSDFQDLVRRPVDGWLDISDEAVVALYDETSGHPYFTKLICSQLFQLMVDRHDSHVTAREVQEAVDSTLDRIERNSFEHFWVDGIIVQGPERNSLIVTRQKVLVALSQLIRQSKQTAKAAIMEEASNWLLSEAGLEQELAEFVRREVLINEGGRYSSKVLNRPGFDGDSNY